MPELHGQPRKDVLRRELRQVRTELSNECKEHRKALDSLRHANCKIEELEAKVQRMEQKAREVLTEAAQDIEDNTWERFIRPAKEKRERCHQSIMAAAAAAA
jgi:hypothetical protein